MQTNTGISYDFEQATPIAREMIMCDEPTYRSFGKRRYSSVA